MIARHRYAFCLLLIVITPTAFGQVKKKIRSYEKVFQFSLFPGISTNGIESGSYYNKFSFNLFGGLSAGNRILELGSLVNVNLKESTGIQIAGLANIVGANAYVNLSQSEERALINAEDFQANTKGIQFAGLLNFVRNNAQGIQFAGMLNVVGGDIKGFQFAGIGNSAGNNTGGTSSGIQIAGFYNIAKEGMGGFQISSLFNFTDGNFAGFQLGAINKARTMMGKKSTPPTRARSLQIGLLNFSKAMDGWQIGLVNFGGDMRGKQIALINFFHNYPLKEYSRMGTPIALLNFGSSGSYLGVSYNELFSANVEYTTGNCLNCTWTQSTMPYSGRFQIYNQNALIAGYDPARKTWGFGYGFQKVLYNRHSMLPSDPLNKKWLIHYGLKFLHLNRELSLDRTFNVLTRLNFDFGKRWRWLYLFAGISANYFLHDAGDSEDTYKISSKKFDAGKLFDHKAEIWPGYTFGLQF
ncbi:MAG TPA: hypothetical protein VIU12_15125 [Chryseolinea sp.]